MINSRFHRALRRALLCAVLLMLALPATAFAAEGEVVTVAYIDYHDFIEANPDGSYTGFGADYLARIADYTGWQYEFVDMDWPSAYEAVRTGAVDFYCVAHQIKERQAEFDFSTYPLCNEEMNLYTLAQNEIYFEDFEAIDGMRIGMLKQSGEIAHFEQYAADNGFSFELVEYQRNDDAVTALKNGEVDAIALVNHSVRGDLKQIGYFGVSPAYMMSRTGSAHMAAFSRAQERLYFDDPGFAQKLEAQYYTEEHNTDLMLTRDEVAFIESTERLRVAVSSDMAPLEYYDTAIGAYRGVSIDIYRVISDMTGLQFDFVPRENAPILIPQMQRDEVQLLGALAQNPRVAAALQIAQTNAFTENAMSLVSSDFSTLSSESVVAVPAGYPQFVQTAMQSGYTNLKEYPSFEACISAVHAQEADLAYIISMCEGYLLDHAQYAHLYAVMAKGTEYGVCFGVSDTADPLLLSILNKCIDTISNRTINEIIVSNTAQAYPQQSIADYMVKNAGLILIAGVALTALAVFAVTRSQKARQQSLLNKQLRQHHEFLQHLYDTLPCGVLQYDYAPPHYIRNYNAACERIYGLDSTQSYVGKAPGAIVKSGTQTDLTAQFHECNKTGKPLLYNCAILRPDGSERYMECVMELVMTEQGQIYQQVFIDVTETHNAQLLANALAAAEKADAAKSQFLSRVSHEMRTPLNAIIGFIELARNANERIQADYLAYSDIAAKQLLRVINDVLDMSSIESGKLTIAKSPFRFDHLISSITNLYGTQCAESGIAFETRLQTPIDSWLTGDELRVNQILINLLGNAVKFTSKGHIHLHIAESCGEDQQVWLHFRISDTGCGISEAFLARLFKPFEQENAAAAVKYGGSGLGLSIVKSLVELMGGAIRVESVLGSGTTFAVDLPIARCAQDQAFNLPAQMRAPRILLLADEEAERRYIGLVLEQLQLRHTCVDSVPAALAALEAAQEGPDRYNICLVDWRAPEQSDIDATSRIRAKYPPDALTIVMMAYDFQHAEQLAQQAGADRYLSKPVFCTALFELLTVMADGVLSKPEPVAQEWDFSGKRVLLVEDNALNQFVEKGCLEKLNVQVEIADNGKQATERFAVCEAGYYDAILMDIQMPIMNGYDATRAIRASAHPDAKTIPIIAQTADAFDEAIAKALAAGMNAHISKPIAIDTLAMALQKAFAQKEGGQ